MRCGSRGRTDRAAPPARPHLHRPRRDDASASTRRRAAYSPARLVGAGVGSRLHRLAALGSPALPGGYPAASSPRRRTTPIGVIPSPNPISCGNRVQVLPNSTREAATRAQLFRAWIGHDFFFFFGFCCWDDLQVLVVLGASPLLCGESRRLGICSWLISSDVDAYGCGWRVEWSSSSRRHGRSGMAIWHPFPLRTVCSSCCFVRC